MPKECSPYSINEDPVQKGCKLPRLSHYPLLSQPLEEKFEIFKICGAVAKRQSLFKMQPPYKVGRKNSLKHPRRTEFDIMFEVKTHGPVQGKLKKNTKKKSSIFLEFYNPKLYEKKFMKKKFTKKFVTFLEFFPVNLCL